MKTKTKPQKLSPRPLEAGLDRLRVLGAAIQAGLGLRVCDLVADNAEIELGWCFAGGRYAGPTEIPPIGPGPTSHCWNVLPDGTIVDATANQFIPDEPMPRVIPPHDDRQSWYRVYVARTHDYQAGWCPNHPARKNYRHLKQFSKNPHKIAEKETES